jgi:hypothetical protein
LLYDTWIGVYKLYVVSIVKHNYPPTTLISSQGVTKRPFIYTSLIGFSLVESLTVYFLLALLVDVVELEVIVD